MERPYFLAIPTTAGTGSEVTNFAVITRGNTKVALIDDVLVPDGALLDASFTRSSQVVKLPKEYGIDFQTGQLTGKIVEGLEAIKVWIWLCLHTERFRHAIYSADYGTSFEQYIGHVLSDEYINTDCESEITDALLINEFIESVEDFEVVRNS